MPSADINSWFKKTPYNQIKAKLSKIKNIYSLGVGIFDLNGNLISKFNNNRELAKHLNISKVTVGKYLNSNLIYNKKILF